MPQNAFNLLQAATILFGIAVITAAVLRRFRVPTVIGFLLAGLIAGPSGLSVIEQGSVSEFADVGLVLLMFIVGLELSIQTLVQTGWRAIAVGLLQILLATLAIELFAWLVRGLPLGTAAAIGIAMMCSSTPIILKILADRGETASMAGKILVTGTVLQDIAVVGFMIFMPLLSPIPTSAGGAG